MDCIFCKIIVGDIPSTTVLKEYDHVVIKDIHPAAPTHLLIIPLKHIANLFVAEEADTELYGRMLLTARRLAEQLQIGEAGFKLRIANGRKAGQEIDHLHIHFLSDQQSIL